MFSHLKICLGFYQCKPENSRDLWVSYQKIWSLPKWMAIGAVRPAKNHHLLWLICISPSWWRAAPSHPPVEETVQNGKVQGLVQEGLVLKSQGGCIPRRSQLGCMLGEDGTVLSSLYPGGHGELEPESLCDCMDWDSRDITGRWLGTRLSRGIYRARGIFPFFFSPIIWYPAVFWFCFTILSINSANEMLRIYFPALSRSTLKCKFGSLPELWMSLEDLGMSSAFP